MLVSFTYFLHSKHESVTSITFRKWSIKYTIPTVRHILNFTVTYILFVITISQWYYFKAPLIFQNSKCPKFQVSSRKGQKSKYTAFPLSLVALISAWINGNFKWVIHISAAAAAAKSLQSCPCDPIDGSQFNLCDPIDSSPPGSPVPGILQARTLEWVAISFSNAWKWKVKVKSLSHVRPSATPWMQPTRILGPWDLPGKSTGPYKICVISLNYICHWNYIQLHLQLESKLSAIFTIPN